nr:integrase, catalytic region, zinc finger, CCHC-type, peptidase aspartic, catalytic [Tanacetum cinerariifolium]
EAAKFVRDFKSLGNEVDASLVKHKALELEIKRLLKAVNALKTVSLKKETEYAKLWNDWYKKCDECKYDKISYDKAYKDTQQKIKRLQAQLGDLKGKSKDTSSISDTRNPLSQKLENKNVELEFQLNYARENAHLKATYKNLFESISTSRSQTQTIITSLQNELQITIYKNAKLRTQIFKKVSDQNDNTQDTSKNTKFAKQPIVKIFPKIGETNALSKPVTLNSVSTPQESKGVNNDKVIAPGMFRINSSKTSREEKHVPNTVSASNRIKLITVSQSPIITKKDVNSNLNGLSSTGVDNTKTRKPQPKSNTKHDRVPSASKSSRSACNNLQIDSQDVISKVVCDMCYSDLFMVHRFGLFQAYDRKSKASHQFRRFCDSYLEVAFRRDACFVRNLEGVDLLKGDRSTNLYTINIHEMASASPICLMARASSTKSWLWHQHLSHLNFDTINDLARNDLVAGLPKFKYHKEHLCPSCEYRKSKRASHLPKPIPNSRTKKIMETMNVSFDEILAMAFEHRSSKLGLQSMTSGQISSRLHLTYAPSTMTMQQPTKGELDLLFEAMYDDYIGGQPSATARTILPAQEPQVCQTSTASTSIADTAPTPTNSSSHATNIPITSQDVDELNSNAMVDGNTFVNPFANSSTSVAASSSSQNVDPSNMHTFYQPYPHEFQ